MIGSQQWNVNGDFACALFFLLGAGLKMVDNNNEVVIIKMYWDDGGVAVVMVGMPIMLMTIYIGNNHGGDEG